MDRRRKILLITALLILWVVFSIPLSRLSRVGSLYLEPYSADEIFDVKELNSFLRVWSQFIKKDIAAEAGNISLQSDAQYSYHLRRWLYCSGWGVERFFALEHRLINLVKVAELQSSLVENKTLASQVKGGGIYDIMEYQKKQLNRMRYDNRELDLVKNDFRYIAKILKGQKITH